MPKEHSRRRDLHWQNPQFDHRQGFQPVRRKEHDMATVLGSVNKLINQTSTQILENHIPQKMADMVNTVVNTGFQIVEDVLKITQDLTKASDSNQGDS